MPYLEIRTASEKRELLRGLRLCKKFALPFVDDCSRIEEDLESMNFGYEPIKEKTQS
jgi:hypothetical protein